MAANAQYTLKLLFWQPIDNRPCTVFGHKLGWYQVCTRDIELSHSALQNASIRPHIVTVSADKA